MSLNAVKSIIHSFGIGDTARIEKLSGGVENTNYYVGSGQNEYVLRIYNQAHSIKGTRTLLHIEEELGFVLACQKTIPVAAPLSNPQGDIFTELPSGRFCVLFTFVHGTSPLAINIEVVKEYARVLDGLYDVSRSYNAAFVKGLGYDIVTRALAVASDYKSDSVEVNNTIEGLRDVIAAHSATINALPQGLVHGDIKLANTFSTYPPPPTS